MEASIRPVAQVVNVTSSRTGNIMYYYLTSIQNYEATSMHLFVLFLIFFPFFLNTNLINKAHLRGYTMQTVFSTT